MNAGLHQVSLCHDIQFGWLRGSQKSLAGKSFWLRGLDLNQRPLGYEGKTGENPIQSVQINSNKIQSLTSLQMPPFAPFRTLFTDKTRTKEIETGLPIFKRLKPTTSLLDTRSASEW